METQHKEASMTNVNSIHLVSDKCIYDATTGKFFTVGDYMYEAIRQYFGQHWPEKAIEDASKLQTAFDKLRKMEEAGQLNRGAIQGFARLTDEQLNNPELGVFTLYLTGVCNLRCGYCPNFPDEGPKYPGKESDMSDNVIDMSIDYFLANRNDNSVFGFYGGEPLLRYDKIRYAVEQLKDKTHGDMPILTITSNLVKCDEQILSFLAENQVFLIVSIDGPATTHDKQRKSLGGKDTFKTVTGNLEKLWEIDPEYFSSHVITNSVITPYSNFEELDQFFSDKREQFATSMFNVANDQNPSFYPDAKSSGRKVQSDLDKWAIEKLALAETPEEAKASLLLTSVLSNNFKHYESPIVDHENHLRPFVSCTPGAKVLVKPNGDMAICEKCDSMIIGHVSTGIDHELGNNLIQGWFDTIQDDCLNCWVAPFCQSCFITAWDDNGYNREKFQLSCSALRSRTKKFLSAYAEKKIEDQHFFDFLDDIDDKFI
jgi:uncharacterized protein